MALSRERIADELLKLLGFPDPAPTVALMVEHGILLPVLPEIEPSAGRLEALVPPSARPASRPTRSPPCRAACRPIPRLPRGRRAAQALEPGDASGWSAAAPTRARPQALAYRLGSERRSTGSCSPAGCADAASDPRLGTAAPADRGRSASRARPVKEVRMSPERCARSTAVDRRGLSRWRRVGEILPTKSVAQPLAAVGS